jgi:dTDP-4-amino-4,6-dideoxygalactose transaminase
LLPHLDAWTQGRRAGARAYEEAGLDELVRTPTVADGAQPAWHLYVAHHDEADRLAAALGEAGVQARGYYRTPIHRQPSMARWAGDVELPVTDELARTNLALPISPVLSAEQAREITAAIAMVLSGKQAPEMPGAIEATLDEHTSPALQ